MPLSLKRFAYASGFLLLYALVWNILFPMNHDYIFPEIAAIALGSLLLDRLPWKVSENGLFIEVTAAGIFGWLLGYLTFLPFALRAGAALLFCAVVMAVSRQFMFPMISAALLPQFVPGGVSVFYVVGVIILTGSVLLLRRVTMARGLQEREAPYSPSPLDLRRKLPGWCAAGAVMMAALLLGSLTGPVFVAAPPLLVGFVELSREEEKRSRFAPLLYALLCAIGAVIGTCFSLVLSSLDYGQPLLRALCFAAPPVLSYGLMLLLKKPFPPAAALSMLPFLLGGQWLFYYPFMIGGGALYFALMAMLLNALRRKKAAASPVPASPQAFPAAPISPQPEASEDLSDFYYTAPPEEDSASPLPAPSSAESFQKISVDSFVSSNAGEDKP